LHEKSGGETSELLKFRVWSRCRYVHPRKASGVVRQEDDDETCEAEISFTNELEGNP
jgi:hypothetical protein